MAGAGSATGGAEAALAFLGIWGSGVSGQCRVTVEEGGTFRAEVPLRQGKQKIAVVTVDAMGRRRQVESVVLRDDSLPDMKVKKRLWQWR